MDPQTFTPALQKVLQDAAARLGEKEATELITQIGTAMAVDDHPIPVPATHSEQSKLEELLRENQRLKHEKRVAEFRSKLRVPFGEESAASIAAALPADLSEENAKLITDVTELVIQAAASKNAPGGFREPVAPFTSPPLGDKRKADDSSRPSKTRERAFIDGCLSFVRNSNHAVS